MDIKILIHLSTDVAKLYIVTEIAFSMLFLTIMVLTFCFIEWLSNCVQKYLSWKCLLLIWVGSNKNVKMFSRINCLRKTLEKVHNQTHSVIHIDILSCQLAQCYHYFTITTLLKVLFSFFIIGRLICIGRKSWFLCRLFRDGVVWEI